MKKFVPAPLAMPNQFKSNSIQASFLTIRSLKFFLRFTIPRPRIGRVTTSAPSTDRLFSIMMKNKKDPPKKSSPN